MTGGGGEVAAAPGTTKTETKTKTKTFCEAKVLKNIFNLNVVQPIRSK
jgi:hypothetical protein